MNLEMLEDALNYIRVNHYGLFHGDADCLTVVSIREICGDYYIAVRNTDKGETSSFNLTEIVRGLEHIRKEGIL